MTDDDLPDDVLANNPCPRCGGEMMLGELRANNGEHLQFVPRDATFWERAAGGSRLTKYEFFKTPALAAAVCVECDLGVFESETDLSDS